MIFRRTQLRWIIALVATLALSLLLAACDSGARSGTSTPTSISASSTQASTSSEAKRGGIVIAEPQPETVLSNTVTVRYQGTASEGSFNVDIRANDLTLASTVVDAEAGAGQSGEFTATLQISPVDGPTEGELRVYTTSSKDGSIDQVAMVPVKLVPRVGMVGSANSLSKQPPPALPTALTSSATLDVIPAHGKAGSRVLLMGSGFPPDTQLEVRLGGLSTGATEQSYDTFRTDGYGNFNAQFIVPDKWPNGDKIQLPTVVILVSTPDFLTKATIEFTYDTPNPAP